MDGSRDALAHDNAPPVVVANVTDVFPETATPPVRRVTAVAKMFVVSSHAPSVWRPTGKGLEVVVLCAADTMPPTSSVEVLLGLPGDARVEAGRDTWKEAGSEMFTVVVVVVPADVVGWVTALLVQVVIVVNTEAVSNVVSGVVE